MLLGLYPELATELHTPWAAIGRGVLLGLLLSLLSFRVVLTPVLTVLFLVSAATA